MSSSDDEKGHLPPLFTPMKASITKSGLKVYKKEDRTDEKGNDVDDKFVYFPSVTYTRKKLYPDSIKTMAYGTSDILKLLVSGGVPPWVFQEEYWQNSSKENGFYTYPPTVKRKKELWEPKCNKNKFHLKIDKSLMEAKLKQKELVQKISKKADNFNKRCEKVLTKRANEMHRGLKAYLDKLERRSKKCQKQTAEESPRVYECEEMTNIKPVLRGYKKTKRRIRTNSPVEGVRFTSDDFDMYQV